MMSWADLVRLGTLATPDNFDLPLHHSFNVAPSQEVLIVRQGVAGPEPAIASWGLVPFWADSPVVGSKMINARAETIASKPAFREAFKQRRCLIPANGFYEWCRLKEKTDKKQPLYIRLRNDKPFAFAGLWEHWDKGDEPLETCTIVTCEANELVAGFHTRMPVILPDDRCNQWVTATDPDEASKLLVPYPADQMIAYPVSRRVNSASCNDIGCIRPLPEVEMRIDNQDRPRAGSKPQAVQRSLGDW
jgi:putative SOS response-associated peptidase YedK